MEEINFFSVVKSPTQIGFDGVINLEPNISCLGPFNLSYACAAGIHLPTLHVAARRGGLARSFEGNIRVDFFNSNRKIHGST